jgi:hypothetical protein
MGKVTNKDIPTQFNRIKVPEGYEWEVHNLHAYEEKKKKFAQGLITKAELEQFEWNYRESAEQREWRWRREHIMKELEQENAKNYSDFKENPKSFAKRMADMGRAINMWWWRRPKAGAGKGKMYQHPITGAWQQQYKPNKSMRMKDWLSAAEKGNVMRHLNPKGVPLNRKPTEDEIGRSEEYKAERGKKVWNWVLNQTNNFGRGWHTQARNRPGLGGGGPGKSKPYSLRGD